MDSWTTKGLPRHLYRTCARRILDYRHTLSSSLLRLQLRLQLQLRGSGSDHSPPATAVSRPSAVRHPRTRSHVRYGAHMCSRGTACRGRGRPAGHRVQPATASSLAAASSGRHARSTGSCRHPPPGLLLAIHHSWRVGPSSAPSTSLRLPATHQGSSGPAIPAPHHQPRPIHSCRRCRRGGSGGGPTGPAGWLRVCRPLPHPPSRAGSSHRTQERGEREYYMPRTSNGLDLHDRSMTWNTRRYLYIVLS